ncbi:hypothetical protein R4Z10_08830 [Niallia sp. XMNu-256]|uniref:hypothetical protein n=1 Tax=Niallia sp. XMNu-256 TaxID=3082444 RepID=UPI0030D35F32
MKDFTKNTLFQINYDEWHIIASSVEQTIVKSPLKQARDYTFHIVDVLKKDKNLDQLDGKYKLRLKFPYDTGWYLHDFIQRILLKMVFIQSLIRTFA